jgi:hypothetical protein
MAMTLLALAALILATPPCLLFLANLRAYRPPPSAGPGAPAPAISVLIPARDEEASIGPAVASALASRAVTVEVVVLDDRSTDATAAVVSEIAARDARVRLIAGPDLPASWCGKQHACARLADAARFPLLAFLDADVRLAPDGLARLAAFLDASGADLVSGIPHQETGTLAERLVIPLIHVILLGFLPLDRMRASTRPAYGAGCGQLFLTRRAGYDRVGGHAAIRASLHDGITLPWAYRRAGLKTDLCDATDVASCRMYRGASALWRGLAKNAGEALAAPGLIVPATLVLAGGQILPFALLVSASRLSSRACLLSGLAAAAAFVPRAAGVVRFRQPLLGAALHPLGVAILLSIQWSAFVRDVIGKPASWKGRPYPARRGRWPLPPRDGRSREGLVRGRREDG